VQRSLVKSPLNKILRSPPWAGSAFNAVNCWHHRHLAILAPLLPAVPVFQGANPGAATIAPGKSRQWGLLKSDVCDDTKIFFRAAAARRASPQHRIAPRFGSPLSFYFCQSVFHFQMIVPIMLKPASPSKSFSFALREDPCRHLFPCLRHHINLFAVNLTVATSSPRVSTRQPSFANETALSALTLQPIPSLNPPAPSRGTFESMVLFPPGRFSPCADSYVRLCTGGSQPGPPMCAG